MESRGRGRRERQKPSESKTKRMYGTKTSVTLEEWVGESKKPWKGNNCYLK